VISTPEELATVLTERFLANATVGDNEANDDLVRQLSEWKHRRRQGAASPVSRPLLLGTLLPVVSTTRHHPPHRISGQLDLPNPRSDQS
ncbi:MAG: hypothetical protein ACRDQ5_24580, partial [Sciscionella sp.]